MEVIARIRTRFPGKFGVPRQSGMTDDEAIVVFEEKYRVPEALSGIGEYSHLWLIWEFSQNRRETFSPTVRPPRLGGNKRVGVFATRSSFRPNSIGLSSVRLLRVEKSKKLGTYLVVSGADMVDNTPIFDIKPYLAYTDSHPDAKCSFAGELSSYRVPVEFEEDTLKVIGDEKEAVTRVLSADPRPSYQNDERSYSFEYASLRITFRCEGGKITVTGAEKLKEE